MSETSDELTPEDVDRCLSHAMFQLRDGEAVKWDALVDLLVQLKVIFPVELAVSISAHAGLLPEHRRGPLFNDAVQSAMQGLLANERANLHEAPAEMVEQLHRMSRGEFFANAILADRPGALPEGPR